MHYRILLRQPGHNHNRVAGEGTFTIIQPPGIVREFPIGGLFKANILAERPCIMRLREHFRPLSEPIEKYHDSSNHRYRTLARTSGNLVMEGPELLLYLHDVGKLATYFVASYAGKNALRTYRQDLARTAKDLMTLSHNVVSFTSRKQESGSVQWWYPVLKATEFTWNAYRPFDDAVREFLEPAKGSPIVSSLATPQRKRYFSQREITNLIEQANDGDYELEYGDLFH